MKVMGCYKNEDGNIKELSRDKEKEIAKKLFEKMAEVVEYEVRWQN